MAAAMNAVLIFLLLCTGYSTVNASRKILESRSAESEGTVNVLIKYISLDNFEETEEYFRQVVALFASFHCLKSESNCQTEETEISYTDVIVTSSATVSDDVEVNLHIRESGDDSVAALTSRQLSDVFYDFEEEIEKQYGYRVEVLDPTRSDWEGWRIAVLTIISFLVLLVIIFAIWLLYDVRKQSEAMAQWKQAQHHKRLSAYESLHLDNNSEDKGSYQTLGDDASDTKTMTTVDTTRGGGGGAGNEYEPAPVTTFTTAVVAASVTEPEDVKTSQRDAEYDNVNFTLDDEEEEEQEEDGAANSETGSDIYNQITEL